MTTPHVSVNWLTHELPDPADQRAYARERVVIAVTEAIAEAMEASNLRRVDIAERLGQTKGRISQVLSGRRNMTLRTLGDILWACNVELEDLRLAPLGEVLCSPEHANEWGAMHEVMRRSEPSKIEVSFDLDLAYSPIAATRTPFASWNGPEVAVKSPATPLLALSAAANVDLAVAA